MKVVGEDALYEIIKHTQPVTIVHRNDRIINMPVMPDDGFATEDDYLNYYETLMVQYIKLTKLIRVYGVKIDFVGRAIIVAGDDNFVEISLDVAHNIVMINGVMEYSFSIDDDHQTWWEFFQALHEPEASEWDTRLYEHADWSGFTIESRRGGSFSIYNSIGLAFDINGDKYTIHNSSPNTNPRYYPEKKIYDLFGRKSSSWGDASSNTRIYLYNSASSAELMDCVSKSFDGKAVKLIFFDEAHKFVVTITSDYVASMTVTNN